MAKQHLLRTVLLAAESKSSVKASCEQATEQRETRTEATQCTCKKTEDAC